MKLKTTGKNMLVIFKQISKKVKGHFILLMEKSILENLNKIWFAGKEFFIKKMVKLYKEYGRIILKYNDLIQKCLLVFLKKEINFYLKIE